MVQAKIRRHFLEPAARRGTGSDFIEVPVCAQKDLLSNVLRLGVVSQKAIRGGIHHVLVVLHEHREFVGFGHC